MRKIRIVLVISILLGVLLIIFGYKNLPINKEKTIGINESLLDYKYCQEDDDCIITSIKKSDCCSVCFVESINKKAELERGKWKKINCNQEDYKACLYAECSVVALDFIAVCENNRCDMKEKNKREIANEEIIDEYELISKTGTLIDTSSLKKEELGELKSDNSNYCNVNGNNEDCMCQKGYVKLKKYIGEGEDGAFTCIPTLCSQVFGHSALGDDDSVIEINYELCIDAVNREKVNVCDIINYEHGKDLCRFAYVERTNDIEECKNIRDEYLKNECYDSNKKIIDSFELELREGTTIDTSDTSKIKKQIYERVIMDDPKYCYGKGSNSNCICQYGYIKIKTDYLFCIPSICTNVFGSTSIGEPEEDRVLEPNYQYCEWAVRDGRQDVCNIIDYQQGKDFCILAYVGRTNQIAECENINDEYLKNECRK